MADTDAYDRSARLTPAYLVFLPAIVFVVALALGTPEWWSKLGGVLVACGAPLFAVQWGRSGGLQKQSELFEMWGGAPTTQLLRFRTGGSTAAVQRRHEVVGRATGIALPTADEEERDPAGADDQYQIAVADLRERTRDEKEFPLVGKENTAYGFRRNLWGRKEYGIAVAILVLGVGVAVLISAAAGHELGSWAAAALATGFAALALVVWLTTVTPRWVREAAEAYARRLFESAVRLSPATGGTAMGRG
jgi:Flp pilus assembly protein TadB